MARKKAVAPTPATTPETVALHTLPQGATFYVPGIGYEGTVEYHGAGSSTVVVRRPEVKRSMRKGKNEKVAREVTSIVEDTDRTQWAPGTMVVPGTMPAELRVTRLEELRRAAGLHDGDDAGAPSAPEATDAAVTEAKAGPRTRRASGAERRMAELAAKRKVHMDHKDGGFPLTFMMSSRRVDGLKVPGLKEVERRAAGKGTSLKLTAPKAEVLAGLLDGMLERDGPTNEYWFLIASVSRYTQVRIDLRDTAAGPVHAVDKKVAK
jgi:hypothetical protein